MRAEVLEGIASDARRSRALMVAIVGLVAAAVYTNSLGNTFAYDDVPIVVQRPLVHDLNSLPDLVAESYWSKKLVSGGLYRPLTMVSFAVDWAIWDGDPFGLHLTNVVLHAAVSALVALFLLLFFPYWAALAGGLVFAVHPVHTEAVANLVGRAEMLTGLFVVPACMLYVRSVREGRISARAIALIAICYALAGFSKETGVVLPGLLLAVDLAVVGRRGIGSFKRYARVRAPLFLVLMAVLGLLLAARWAALGAALENVPHLTFALDGRYTTRLFTMARIWPRYFELLVLPLNLSADYSPATILPSPGLTPQGALGFLLVLGSIAIAVVAYRRTPELTAALAWAAIAILPVSNLIVAAEIVLAERTLYLPSIACSMVVALALARAPASRKRWLAAGFAVWVVGFSWVTVKRNPVWYDTDTVFEDLRRQHPESARLLFHLAVDTYHEQGWERARPIFDAWYEVWPHHSPWLAEYADVLRQQGLYARADTMIRKAVEFRPTALGYYTFWAVIRIEAGELDGALQVIEKGLARRDGEPDFYALRARVYERLGEYERAVEAQRALVGVLDETDWAAWSHLARLQAAAGDTAAALESLTVARGAASAPQEVADSLQRAWSAVP